MKKNKATWILLGVVVVLSLYTYFGEYQGKEKEKVREEQQAIILKGINADQVNFIEINNLEQKITLSRSSDGWSVTAPIKDSADNADIESWLKQLTEEKTMSVAVEGNDIKWQYFGFDQPVKTITVKTNSNQQVTVEVSDKKNFEGNSFIRFPGENKVMVGSSGWSTYASKKVFDVRNKHLFRHQLSNVQSFQIKNKSNTIDIQNKDAKWITPKQPNLALDQNVIRENINKINELKAIEFVAENEDVARQIKKLNLGPSIATIDVKLTEGSWTGHFYEAKDKTVYAEVVSRHLLVKIGNEIITRFSGMKLTDLLDYRLPFASFDKTKVEKFAYETTLKKASLVKKNSVWELDPADSANEVQQDKVSSLLEVIKNVVAKEYLAPKAVKKDITKQKIVFKDSSDQVYFELQFSEAETKKINNEEKTFRYAKTNLYDEPFLLDESEFNKLSLNDIIKIKVNNEGKALPVDAKKEVKNGK
tara:strand:- start:86318 stop:87745 length:1428 start_codon:yes stop_codon:yes gene_type:complete